MDTSLYPIFYEAFRLVFLLGAPVLITLMLSGTLVSAFQSITSLHDPASAYAVRVLALIALFYFLLPSFTSRLINFAEMVYR